VVGNWGRHLFSAVRGVPALCSAKQNSRHPRFPGSAGANRPRTRARGDAFKGPATPAGSPKGAERIAACWARKRKINQIEFKPDWNRHAKAAPFKRNDVLLQTLPIGIVVFPGSGISDNLADKARKLGIPLMDYR
jgi:YspA, cpYpsA-related SLOG family